MKLERLLEGLDAKWDSVLGEIDITSITSNSKDVKTGSLFVAIKGFRFDGHKFLTEAFAKGALVSLVESSHATLFKGHNIIKVKDTRKALSKLAKNFYCSPSEKLKVIGITGTNGKTTTSLLIESILNESCIPCGVIGTMGYKTGGRYIPTRRTTPDALSINAILEKMLKRKLKAVVMEVSSHALDQRRVEDIYFNAAIFTNLTHEHLDYHGDLKQYFKSKAKIFANLKKEGTAILNADDKNARACIKDIKKHKCLTYGIGRDSDISARIEKVELDSSSFMVKIYKKDAFWVDTKLVGLHNISNILAAVAAGITQDINLGTIKKGIEKVDSIPGRLEPVSLAKGFKVFIDYAHTHNALENVLKFLKRIKTGDIITVFGCGGERDKAKRPLMGKVAQDFSDFVIITSDNPRSEDPERVAHDIESGMNKKNNYTILLDRAKAIEKALQKAKTGDIVLIAGKGHETEQVLRNGVIPFNDRKVAEVILRSKIKMKKSILRPCSGLMVNEVEPSK